MPHSEDAQHHTFPHCLPHTHTFRSARMPWKQAEQKEKCRSLEARLRVHERQLSTEMGRWKEEADRADEMSGRIGAAESERDAAVKRYVLRTCELKNANHSFGEEGEQA